MIYRYKVDNFTVRTRTRRIVPLYESLYDGRGGGGGGVF
jgi:hypothetical protein